MTIHPHEQFGAITGGGGGFDGPRVGGQGSQENIARGIHSNALPNKSPKEWKGLSAEAKLHFVRYAPTWTTLQLIEAVEEELRINNS